MKATEVVAVMVAPVLGGERVAAVQQLVDGRTNTTLRVTPTGGGADLLLRITRGSRGARDREVALLEVVRAAGAVPVPEVLHRGDLPRPFVVSRWIDGTTLDDARARLPAAIVATVAEPLGEVVARVAQVVVPEGLLGRSDSGVAIALAERRLGEDPVRDRLGAATADALRALLERVGPRLRTDEPPHLVHGDLGGRNLLVRADRERCWIAGLIDWELAFRGSGLWDAGSVLRSASGAAATFREDFARGYRRAGGALPDDWVHEARLLDATRAIATLASPRASSRALADCRATLAALVADEG